MKITSFLPLTLFLLLLNQSAFSSRADDFTPDQMPVYKTIGETELRLHIFNPPGHQASDRRPAIVFFFGGGWKSGSPSQFYPHCDYLASRGIVAISAEYRVNSRHNTTPQECVRDGKSAIRWLRQHAGELGIDPDKIAAGGGSAGGHVAAATGTLSGYDETDEDLSISSRPNALVLFNPVIDNGPTGYGYDRVSDYWKEFSPLHNINDNTPPTTLFLGTEDKLIPVKTVLDYQQRMTNRGIRCDVHLYPGQPHGFFNHRNTQYFEDSILKADRFLESIGYLEGEPTLKPGELPQAIDFVKPTITDP